MRGLVVTASPRRLLPANDCDSGSASESASPHGTSPEFPSQSDDSLASARLRRGLVLALILLALALRAGGLTWGAPLDPYTGYYHPDERKIARGAVDFPADILTRSDLRYPTGYHYAVGTLALPLRWLMPRLWPDADVFLAVFMLARLTTLVLGVLSVALLYLLGRRFYGPAAGLVAAAFLAIVPIHVIHGAWATLDVPTAFLAIIALWACDRVMTRPTWGNAVLLGLASGLLIGTKYPGAVIVVPALLAHLIGRHRAAPERGWLRAVLDPHILLYAAVTVATTLATTPTILLHPEHLLAAVRYESARQGLGGLSGLEADLLWDVLGGLETVAGRAIGWFFALGTLAALYRPTRREVIQLAFLVPYYLALGDRAGGRYLIILLPAYCLLAGRLVWLALGWIGPRPVPRAAVAVVVGIVWLLGLRETALALELHHQPDARTSAARYFGEHAPAGSTVCITQPSEGYPQDWKNPRVSGERYAVVDCGAQPEWVLWSGGGEKRVEEALASPHLGADYTWDPAEADAWPDDKIPSPEMLRFYEAVFPGRDGVRDYGEVALFENVELPIAPFQVSRVRVLQRVR